MFQGQEPGALVAEEGPGAGSGRRRARPHARPVRRRVQVRPLPHHSTRAGPTHATKPFRGVKRPLYRCESLHTQPVTNPRHGKPVCTWRGAAGPNSPVCPGPNGYPVRDGEWLRTGRHERSRRWNSNPHPSCPGLKILTGTPPPFASKPGHRVLRGQGEGLW